MTRADILRVFLQSDGALLEEAERVVGEFVVAVEDVQVAADRGVLIVRGRVASPGRRSALLRRLWEIDGVVAVDDRHLQHSLRDVAISWE